ncbi:MAG: rebM 5 [Thermoleophilia bacterium]|nr:rebM 5 [Thermoleophilia bacterium]
MRLVPPLPSLPLPGPLARARTRALARTRRAGVNVLMRAARLPVTRPVVEPAMRLLFDSLAPTWEQIRADPTYRVGFTEALGHLPRGFRPRRTLDVACGTGIATAAMLERWPGSNVLGTDISPRMVELATELVPEARFEVASVHGLPYDDGAFDLVTALDGLIDPAELLRVLHRKGRLLIVYSKGGTTPISRPLDELAGAFADHGAISDAHTDGEAHVLVVRHGR